MALTKVINDLADLNQSGSTNALKGCAGTTAQQPASSSTVEYLMVAGGGGGGGWGQAGGGGAGGYVTGSTTVYHGTPTVITIGEGGAGGYSNSAVNSIDVVGLNGDDSGFNGLRAIGGGGGGSYNDPGNSITITYAVDGGSGGGAGTQGQNNNQFSGEYGEGIIGQGHDGGTTYNASGGGYGTPWMGGGGGGAGASGSGGLNAGTGSGNGGVGIQINDSSGINMISTDNAVLAGVGENSSGIWVSGGGGGGAYDNVASSGGKGGASGTAGGNATGFGYNGTDGMVNTGAGGSGASGYSNISPGSVGTYYRGGAGGSGLGILKYNNTEVTGYTLNSEDTYTVNWPADKYGAAYWPLNLNVKDVGGNYDGTATDVTYVTGKFNQAASFNGSSSIIQGTQPAQSESFTISAWVKTTASGAWNIAVAMGATATHVYGLSMWISTSNSLYAQWGNGSSEDIWGTLPTTPINTGEWFHIAITVNNIASPTVKGYINGVLEGSGTNAGSPVAITYDPSLFTIGGRENTSGTLGYYWNGEIEQVRFYGSELSLTDIQDIYNNSKPGSLPPLKTSSDLTTTICNFPSGATGTALYQFEGTANDSCTVGPYNGTFTNSAYETGKFGPECASFNGSSSRVNTGYNIPGSLSGFSVSAWVKAASVKTQYIVGDMGTTGAAAASMFYINISSSNELRAGVGGTVSQVIGTMTNYINNWTHVVVTTDSSGNIKGYVNGIQLGTATGNALSSNTEDFIIGMFKDGSHAATFDGLIDQVRIFQSELSSQQIYDLWQKENDIQTHFSSTDPADTTPADRDILVFKEGSGEITFKNDSPPGAEVGMLRYNSTLGQMEHFNSGGWKDFTNCTTSICNYPITARCLYTFNGNYDDLCGNTTPDLIQNVYFTPGKFDKLGWNVLGLSSYLGYSKIGWSSGLIADYNATDFSISLWLKLNAYGGASALQYPYIWSGWSNAYWSLHMANTGAANTISFGSWSSADGSNEVHSGVVALDTWYHIVCTRSTTTGIQLYLNNVLISTLSTVYNGQTASVYDMMGGYGDTSFTRQGLDGTISQFRLFEAVLTPTQISQLYNEVSCPNN